MNLSFWLARGFDFALSLGVTSLIPPVMNIIWIGSFWGVGFDMLNCMEFGDLVGLF